MPDSRTLVAVLARTALGESDPDLVVRWAAHRDEDAFATLVRRYAGLVRAVCRRHLGDSPDADDAAQAAFLVLARDAHRIADRSALPGWLYRVADRAARKARGRRGRRPTVPLTEADGVSRQDPVAEASERELQAALADELGRLPDRLRAVIVLCGLNGRTSAEAAAVLGCPTGTVDSRLHAARKVLGARFARRGLAGVGLAGVGWSEATGGLPADVIATAVRYVNGGPGALPAAALLANEVFPMALLITPRIVATVVLVAGLCGATGVGLYSASADGGPMPGDSARNSTRGPVAKALAPETPESAAATPAGKLPDTREILNRPTAIETPLKGRTLKTVLDTLQEKYEIPFIVREDLFRRADPAGDSVLEKQFQLETSRNGVPLRTFLNLTLPDIDAGYIVRPGYIEIVPAGETLRRIVFDTPITLGLEDTPLRDAVRMMREQTGANIVLDVRADPDREVSAEFDNVPLRSALAILADMADISPVYVGNVCYLTGSDSRLKKESETQGGSGIEPFGPGGAGEFGSGF